MSLAHNKRNVVTLYTEASSIEGHQIRIILAEKEIQYEQHLVDPSQLPEDFLDLNPCGLLPTLVDRGLVLYKSRIIAEYLDERFPHPPLMPVYPVARAEARKVIYRIEEDWYALIRKIQTDKTHEKDVNKESKKARVRLLESILQILPIFSGKPYFLSTEFSLLDCCVVPILWRLPQLGITLPKQATPVYDYMARIFERLSFKNSLTDKEKETLADVVAA